MFAKAYKLTDPEKAELITLLSRPEFKSLERLIEYQIALYTDKAMQSEVTSETEAFKAGVSALKEITRLCKTTWEEAQKKTNETIQSASQKKIDDEKKLPKAIFP